MLGGSRRSHVAEFHLKSSSSGYTVVEHGFELHRTMKFDEDSVHASAILWDRVGPSPRVFAWRTAREFEIPAEWMYRPADQSEITDLQQTLQIESTVIAYAKDDQLLATYRPGVGLHWEFSLLHLGKTALFWSIHLCLAYALAWFIWNIPKWYRHSIEDSRFHAGCCRSCGYDRTGLEIQPCPECGVSPEKSESLKGKSA